MFESQVTPELEPLELEAWLDLWACEVQAMAKVYTLDAQLSLKCAVCKIAARTTIKKYNPNMHDAQPSVRQEYVYSLQGCLVYTKRYTTSEEGVWLLVYRMIVYQNSILQV